CQIGATPGYIAWRQPATLRTSGVAKDTDPLPSPDRFVPALLLKSVRPSAKCQESDMCNTRVHDEAAPARSVEMQLEVVVIPVSDVDRAKRFYTELGWRLDADFVVGDDFRGVQFTPPGSACSIHFGTGITS